MSCTVRWTEEGSVVSVDLTGVVDAAGARRLSAELASHVGIDGVEVIEVDASTAVLEPAGQQALDELARRFAGAGQRLVVTAAAPEGDRAAALR